MDRANRDDGTMRIRYIDELCDWLTEHVVGPNLDISKGDREEMNLRNLLRMRRRDLDYLSRIAPLLDDPRSLELMRANARRVAEDPLLILEYVDPLIQRALDQGYVKGLESAIHHLADRYQAYPGIGGIFRAPVKEN